MKLKNQIVTEFHDLHWGTFLASKIQFIITLAILFGVYEIKPIYKVFGVILAIILIWLSGKIWRIYFKEDFQNKMYEELKNDISNNNN